MKTFRFINLIALLLLALALLQLSGSAAAQGNENPEYRLNVKRNFGFSSGSQIKGSFTNSIVGPAENIQSVTYLVDGTEVATITEAPFSFNYQTTDFSYGWHEMSARVTTKDGRTVETPNRRFQFVTSEEEFAGVQKIIVPLIGGVVLLMGLTVGVQMLFMRDKTNRLPLGAPRQYGLRGGTICKRCGRPFPIHFWAMNMGLWKFDRCEFCGHWSFVRRSSPAELRQAELAELEDAGERAELPSVNKEEELRKKLDDTRYTGS